MLTPELVRQISDRKLSRFALACCRRAWAMHTGQPGRSAMELAEQIAENENSPETWDKAASVAGRAWAPNSNWDHEAWGERRVPATVIRVISELGAALATRQT